MKYEIIKFINNNVELEVTVSPEEKTVWLTKEQIASLFDRDRSVISRHINRIYKEGELDKNTSVHFLHFSFNDTNPAYRPPEYYNLDLITSIGYRVKSQNGLLLKQAMLDYLSKKEVKNYDIIV